ncbi:MAG: alpha/beta fold hydrolase [Burkholderiales bacterium]|nr:alpha/beta fold hydrolase [Burkholderiales bacterium]
MWAPLVARLQDSFDIVAVDLPGFGRDTARTAPGRLEDFARAVIDTVNECGLDRFNLMGHSMGGMIAQQVALECGSRIDRLVLYGTAGSGELRHRFEPIEASIQRLRVDGVRTVARSIVRSWFIGGEADPGFELCAAATVDVRLESAIAALTAITLWDMRPRLGELTMPCLVIGGDSDRSTPPDELLALRRGLPRAELCILPGSAHAAHLESTYLFNAVTGKFLTTLE